jgi:hypothetical protein
LTLILLILMPPLLILLSLITPDWYITPD